MPALLFPRVAAAAMAALPLSALAADAASLDEVVVTATRRAEPLQQFPGSLSLVTADDVAAVGAGHHAELLNRAPGVLFQRNSGQESLTAIRSPVLTGPGSCGTFLFLENGVPVRPAGFCNVNQLFEVDLGELAGVEIGRGPMGALYGSSAMHGAVNVLQAAPDALPAAALRLERGAADYTRLRATGSLQQGERQLGITAMAEYDGGWREQSTTRQQKVVAQLAQPLGEATASLMLSYTRLDQETAGFITGFEAYRDPAIARSNANPEAFRDAHALRLTAGYAKPLQNGWSLDLRPYLRSSRMEFLQHFLIGKPLENNGQDSGGLLLAVRHDGEGGRSTTLGVDLEAARMSLREFQANVATDGAPAANAIRPQGLHYDYTVDSRVGALYAHTEQPLGERFKATLGLRGEFVEYRYDNRMLAGNTRDDGTTCGATGCLYSRPADRHDDFLGLTPKATLSWQLLPSQLLYASVARGYRAPDTSELYRLQRQQSIADLDAERLDNLELGLRGNAGRLRYVLGLFAMRKDNVILRDSGGFNISNGRTTHRGLEYEFSWRPWESLTVSVDGTLAQHKYDFDQRIEGGEVIVSGRDIDTAPRRVHNARMAWQPLAPLSFELEWQHVGRYFVDAGNANAYGGHDVLDLRGSWQFAPAWRGTLRVDNLADTAYADRADYAFGTYRYFPGRGRTLFMALDWRLPPE
ncbi:MAG: hypothetical protein RL026_648 [Pseudomonadota bacterium]